MADLLSDVTPKDSNTNPEAEPGASNTKPETGQAGALDKLFGDLGGGSAVARILGVGASTASEMKRRGSIPIEHWPALIMSDAGKAIGLTEGRLLFAHTGVVVDNGRSLVPVAPPKDDDDPEAKWRWTSRDPDLLLNTQPATRVYRNGFGQVVICQEARGDDTDDEPFVFFEITNIPKLIAALQREAKNG